MARRQLAFQFLTQDFRIQEGGSQDFLIQNVSGSTGFNRWVGACCLSVAGPTVAQLEVFFSSDYL